MDGAPDTSDSFAETVVFLSHFKDLHDPRQRGKVCYPLEEILLLGGVAEDVEIAFGGASGLGDMTASGGEIKGH